MTSSEAAPPTLATRLKDIASFVAPTTLITALLLYFGYVGTQARFAYFGVYLNMTDLANQDLVLYGLEVVYVPAALTLLVTLAAIAIHIAVSWLLTRTDRTRPILIAAGLTAVAAFLLIARAVIGLLVPAVARREIPGTTALALALGPLLIVYGTWIAVRVLRHRNADDRFTTWYGSEVTRRLRRLALAATAGLVVAGLFYAANSFAAAYGAGRGYDDAIRLPRQPEIVIDTKERLIDLPPGVIESALPAGKDTTFHFRYAGLRLLLESGERLFLVPGNWTAQSKTLVVPYDSDVRIQLIPRHQ